MNSAAEEPGRNFRFPLDKRRISCYNPLCSCECSSSGRAPPCQGGGSEFEPRHSLQKSKGRCNRPLLFWNPWVISILGPAKPPLRNSPPLCGCEFTAHSRRGPEGPWGAPSERQPKRRRTTRATGILPKGLI